MNKSRLIETALEIDYELAANNAHEFAKEFGKITQSDNDPIGEWLRLTKAKRGGMDSENAIILDLLVEVYRKIESLEKTIQAVKKEYLPLANQSEVITIGHGCFALKDSNLQDNMLYYGRIELPTFPTRIIPVYFVYHSNLAWIDRMHGRDEAEWDGYVASKERALIRSSKKRT